ncbi:acyl-CoA thioesterase [Streptosporangiaceae bacterium NEAU-GS5]|nr:acyl-CoA thioesterase [Streptosporangiaceae bacterium NEAU-GS5]
MSSRPIVYETRHRIKFSDLDPYNHMSTGRYAAYFTDHRMQSLGDNVGWNLKTLETLPFMVWVRRMEIDFIRPVLGDQQITITSYVSEFRGPDGLVECAMIDAAGKKAARCLMVVAYVDKATNRGADWPSDIQALFFEDSPDMASA